MTPTIYHIEASIYGHRGFVYTNKKRSDLVLEIDGQAPRGYFVALFSTRKEAQGFADGLNEDFPEIKATVIEAAIN